MADKAQTFCGNDDHGRPVNAIARLSWPDLRYKPTTACIGDMQWSVRNSLDEGHPVLVEPASEPETHVAKAMKEVAVLHYRAYSSPVRAILLEAPDMPCYDELPETLEERRKLPARFHIPRWDGDGQPNMWLCAVCWEEGVVYSWPCEVAAANGGEVFAR
ncbi:hypothetical protein [Nonomuraea sp. NPDC003804]|uniref:hypothetical protein n=1 Tax=Nonomuraea sp. NPDC003804 TaxID=3154547 RepID=UPI0033AAC34D